MRVLKRLAFIVLVGALAACSQQGSAPYAVEEVSFHTLPTGLQGQATTLSPWDFAAGQVVEVIGVGLGAHDMGSCEVVEETLTIPDLTGVTKLYAQVVVKGKDANPNTDPPALVRVSAGAQVKTWTADGTDSDSLNRSFVNPQGGPLLTEGGQVYEGVFEPAASITARVEGAVTEGYCQPRAFVVYVFRDSDTSASAGKTPNYYVYWNEGFVSATETIDLPEDFAGGDVEVTFAIGDLEDDERTVVLSASAGGVSATATFSKPNRGEELLIHTLTLAGVPAGTKSVTATVTSPSGEGDSVYWNGLNVTISRKTPPPPPGGEGCTPGYWRQPHHYDSWVGYSPTDSYNTVFGVNAKLSLKTKGKPQTSTNATLGQAVEAVGGGENALARHAVAALLNASSPEVSYAYTVDEVVALVQQAYATGDFETAKNLLAAENERGCPLN